MTVEISRKWCSIKKSGRIVVTGSRRGMLIKLDVEESEECEVAGREAELCHRRLGHVSYSTVNKMVKDG